jgi:hypothetical protein
VERATRARHRYLLVAEGHFKRAHARPKLVPSEKLLQTLQYRNARFVNVFYQPAVLQ